MSNKKTSEFNNTTSLQTTDLIGISHDNGDTTYTSNSITVANFKKHIVYDLGNVSGSVTTNVINGEIFTATLTGTITLSNPINAINGQAITWYLTQGSGGGKTINLDTKFNIPSSATTPLSFSNVAGKMDILAVRYDSVVDKFHVVSMIPGY